MVMGMLAGLLGDDSCIEISMRLSSRQPPVLSQQRCTLLRAQLMSTCFSSVTDSSRVLAPKSLRISNPHIYRSFLWVLLDRSVALLDKRPKSNGRAKAIGREGQRPASGPSIAARGV